MNVDRRTPQNTAVVIVDPMTAYANLFRSQSIEANVNGTVALVKTALGFGVPLVVTATSADSPRGALYPAVADALGDHPVVRRARWFDAFDDPEFEAAVAVTERRHLVIAGLMTEGCVLATTLGALRRGFGVSLVVDASAGETEVQHQAAVARLAQLGATPVTWFSFATELQRTYLHIETVDIYYELMSLSPIFANGPGAQPVRHELADQPTAIMQTRLVHDVHRRASRLLADAAARPGVPAAALRELRDFLVTTLRHHHTCEDEQLWPLIAARAPDAGDALEELTQEHERLETALEALERAEIGTLGGAAARLHDLVDQHERHEERILFPALRSAVSEEDWRTFADFVHRTDTTAAPHLTIGFIDLVATPQEAERFFAGAPVAAMRHEGRATLDLLEQPARSAA